MPFSVSELAVEDFTGSGWRDAIEGARERDCMAYCTAFHARHDKAHETGNVRLANLFALLAALASMWIDADDPADPLKPMLQGAGDRTAIPSDFDPALGYLADIL